ncbi:prepilin-type N-terminal cleavage/methylation domain-containing protein [Actinoplanes sp. NPDC023801]|uniref:PulJ/GspJ family protein n=1 Tax=Actinoplanes sp. NPDC023801 TaxID=3154595 RepID=UPI0033CCEBF7
MTAAAFPGPREDDGVTLVEVMVAMTVMSVVMSVFTAAVIQAYRSVNATTNTSAAQTQLHLAFQLLDREVRYASGITVPNTTAINGAWYVEFLGIEAGTGKSVCHQLRLDATGVLQQLTWTPGSAPAAGTRGHTLASQLMAPGGTIAVPFQRQDAGSMPDARPAASAPVTGADFTPDYQRLRVQLTTTSGTSSAAQDVTFTALNTSRATTDPNVCIEGRPQ